MRVAFRVDASAAIGAGHLMRCLALAGELAARAATCTFVARPLPATLRERVECEGHAIAELPTNGTDWRADAAATLDALARSSTDWLVVDHYGLDARWHSMLRADARRLLVIDDMANRPLNADLLLNQNLVDAARYRSLLDDPTAIALTGPRYALLRPEFRRETLPPRRENALPAVAVMFGGTDPHQITQRVVEALRPLAGACELHVVGGPLGDAAALRDAIAGFPGATLHQNLRRVGELLRRVDIVVGAPGSSTWERCACGVASVTLSLADNQDEVGATVALAGAAVHMGRHDHLDAARLVSTVGVLLRERGLRDAMESSAQRLVDGRGASRVAAEMFARMVSLRAASLDDADLLLAWRNDPAVRDASFDSAPLDRDTHLAWMRCTLGDPRRALFVVCSAGAEVGSLRLDLNDAQAVVSLYLAPGRGGGGLGRGALRAAEAWVRSCWPEVRTLIASIRADNSASERAFAAAGYRLASTTMHRHLTPC